MACKFYGDSGAEFYAPTNKYTDYYDDKRKVIILFPNETVRKQWETLAPPTVYIWKLTGKEREKVADHPENFKRITIAEAIELAGTSQMMRRVDGVL